MQPKLLPPPPLPEGASPWEPIVAAEVRPVVESLVRKVRGLAWANLDHDDATQRVMNEVFLACRRWQKCHGPTKPAERYVWAAVHRARHKLYRSVKRAGPGLTGQLDEQGDNLRATAPSAHDLAVHRAQQRLYVEVTAGLFANMDPEDATLMRLSAEGLAPADIAMQVGRPGDNVAVAQRLYVLRRRAREHLRRMGIETLEDVHELRESPFDVHAD